MVPFMTEWTVYIVENSYFQLVGRLIFSRQVVQLKLNKNNYIILLVI